MGIWEVGGGGCWDHQLMDSSTMGKERVCEVWEVVSLEPGDYWTWGHDTESALKDDTLVSGHKARCEAESRGV